MRVEKTKIEGVFVIYPQVYEDERGYFTESFNEKEFNEKTGADFHPVQDNESLSSEGVLRGLHFQRPPHQQAKLVRVVQGKVLDVAVDLRPGSKTYGKYVSVILDEHEHNQFFIPKGFAHGFYVLTEMAKFQYKCDDYYHPECEDGIAWDDEDIDIKWTNTSFHRPPKSKLKLSKKDIKRKTLKEYTDELNNGND
jgi:dTDP-4-dehydrorhamnose 3,5-epimerase